MSNHKRGMADLEPIILPKPSKKGSKTLLEALQLRRTERGINSKEIPLQVLSNLLWAAFGVTIATIMTANVLINLTHLLLFQTTVVRADYSVLTLFSINMLVIFTVSIPLYMRLLQHPKTGPIGIKNACHIALAIALIKFMLLIGRMELEGSLMRWRV